MLNRKICTGIAAMFFSLAACSSDYTGPNGEGIPPAHFNLQTINAQGIPLTAAIRNGVRIEILSGTFDITSTYQFTSSTTYRRTETNGQFSTAVENCVGTYAASHLATGAANIVFTELGSENAECGVQLSPVGVGGRNRVYSGNWDGGSKLTIDFDVTTRSVYGK
ncbi:MAG TPA: hypothetical protein VNC11_03160 [Gemmatimonadaceae bacterium]|jgi:hypothetical protein|nr:hypothetical protein [Gemmatimonadaceae bacterium]